MPGVQFGDIFAPKPQPAPFSSFGDPASFTAAATQQAKDYDKIMQNYQGIADSASSNPVAYKPTTYSDITPQLADYRQSGDVTQALSNLGELSRTGGYDTAGINELRERGISPIRSVYANASQNLNRAKSLGGGYAPGYGALTAKMAREEAGQIGKTVNDVNAGIAQNVATNKIATAPAYSSAALSANSAKTAADKSNADIVNQINQFNAQNNLSNNQANSQGALSAAQANNSTKLGAVNGQTSLYGTTPALTSTFGNQVMAAQNSNQNQQQINNQVKSSQLQPLFGNSYRMG